MSRMKKGGEAVLVAGNGLTCRRAVQVETGGEAVIMAGMPNGWGPMGLTDSQLDTTLARIKAKAAEIGADANVLRRTMVPYSQPGQADSGPIPHWLNSLCTYSQIDLKMRPS